MVFQDKSSEMDKTSIHPVSGYELLIGSLVFIYFSFFGHRGSFIVEMPHYSCVLSKFDDLICSGKGSSHESFK